MADFGQTQNAQNGIKMAELGAKMEPRELQDVQDGACLTILRPIGEACLTILTPIGELSWTFWKSWGRSFQK
jgi:hypothetical protein